MFLLIFNLIFMQILLDKMVVNGIAGLHHYHSQHRVHIMNLLGEERLHMKSIINMVEEKIRQFDVITEQTLGPSQRIINLDENECRDVHINTDADSALVSKVC